jgi:very-short-patch-repair endonuclease
MTDEVAGADTISVFQSALPIGEKLERARTELLDLSARNRLLNIPQSARAARSLEVVDENSGEIFRLLVREGRPFTFLAGRADPARQEESSETEKGLDEEIAALAQPDDDSIDARGILNRHADTKLQTRLTPAGLQKRLLDLYVDARTLEEEQGVNILYLALGTLKWIDPSNIENVRFAPLVLVPVALERGNAAEKFKLRWRQEDTAANLSLEAFLDKVHGIRLPPFDTSDDFDPLTYIAGVREAVSAKPGWSVQTDHIVLGFFSFAKFLMYRDLDASLWPKGASIVDQPLIRGLLAEGFPASEDLVPEDGGIDPHIAPSKMLHIVDSDSSQTVAVHEVRRGANIVIQGPPGTGKSQTIANIIASAIADGKKVLFLAEKMAALEVVKRRLDSTGVGDACLELHSNKANKRALLEELKRTWHLGSPRSEAPNSLTARLLEARDTLNAHADRLHRPTGAAGLSPFKVIGQLARLKLDGMAPNDIKLEGPTGWSADEFAQRQEILAELAERVADIGTPVTHSWAGIGLGVVLPADVDRLAGRIDAAAAELGAIGEAYRALTTTLALDLPVRLEDIVAIQWLAGRVAGAPLPPEALGASAWEERTDDIHALLAAGAEHERLAASLIPHLKPGAYDIDPHPTHAVLAPLPSGFSHEAFARIARLEAVIPTLMDTAARLIRAMGQNASDTLRDIAREIEIGERVAAAPDASPQAFLASLWDNGVERAGDLADAVATLETVRAEIGSAVSDAAWENDLREQRATLAMHGSSLFRWFNGDWRRANRLVRSFLTHPAAPVDEVVATLDLLARGQVARQTVREGQALGEAAFDHDWRGEKSNAVPLQMLVAWMRSLRGLGTEPRLIASRNPPRSEMGALAAQTRLLHDEVRSLFFDLSGDLQGETELLFDPGKGGEESDLDKTLVKAAALAKAWAIIDKLFADIPSALGDTRKRLSDLIAAQDAKRRLDQARDLGGEAFGSEWKGSTSKWAELEKAADWIDANSDIRLLAAGITDRAGPLSVAETVNAQRQIFAESLTILLQDLKADLPTIFGQQSLENLEMDRIAERLTSWSSQREALSKWVTYCDRAGRARVLGLGALVERLHGGALVPTEAMAQFEMSYYETIFAQQAEVEPEIARFDGDLHSRRVREFGDLDRQRIATSSYDVVRAHHRTIPPASGGAVGPLGTLRSEIARKRGHMPIRQLMHRAAPAVQALKPVFMMSPLSVAQFLPPGDLEFDMLVMDEASQIQPVDALGAIARCRQVVVVGDPKQLPPTAFFAKVTSNVGEDDGEDGAGVADIESILGLFMARGLPTRMLRWHYRSRHQSLIAVSNKQFYENKLYIIPSPHTAEAGMGLRFHHIPSGIFETGTTRTNPVEAKIVANAIVQHAKQCPEQSLGVATFSSAQRRAIMEQLELLRRTLSPEEEAFFQDHPSEPFFIKNLENVQGDERDVIFISVGYGPSAPGRPPAMRFGPLGSEGGERRLNVLISRAKRRCEVFSSITDEQIDPDFAASRKGVFAFKLFLHFARTGRLSMGESTGGDHDSVFEEQVARALHERGHQVRRQVGIAGLFVDLAVTDPDFPDRYILGIECDGASYQGARSARDRDRLRQTILEDHGWIMHRIWSTDWFKRPFEQLEKTIAAIEAAKAELRGEAGARLRKRAVPVEIITIEREDVTEIGLLRVEDMAGSAIPYVEAAPVKPPHMVVELHAAPRGILTEMVQQVVAVEGPVHIDEVVNRIREAWGLKRAGARIQDAIEEAAEVAVRLGRLEQYGDFLAMPGVAVRVRDRSAVGTLSLRQPQTLPPSEIRAAMNEIVRSNLGATRDEILVNVSRMLGFKSTKGLLRGTILPVIEQALTDKELVEQNGVLTPGPAAEPPPPVFAGPEELEALISTGEGERLEFKETLRWDVVQNQINKKLEDVVVKTIAAFANGVGGTLLIGVRDDGTTAGLDPDFQCLGGNADKMELHLTSLLARHFGQSFRASRIRITFPLCRDIQICKVDIRPAGAPIFVSLADARGVATERFYVRSGNSSQELTASQTQIYVQDRYR